MAPELLLIGLFTLLLSGLLTWAMRGLSWRHGLVDVPNERSSHRAATPRGGGLPIVVAASLALLLLRWRGAIGTGLFLALIGGGSAVAAVGFLDDRRRLPAGLRLTVHVAAGLWALQCLGGLPPLAIGHRLLELGWAGNVLALLGIVWTLNLFNFMDGIDGIAASEAVFITGALALLGLLGAHSPDIVASGIIMAAACVGFLLWNWPPASIFMGDVGSGYLGFVIAVTVLAQAHDDHAGIWMGLILGAVFFADATVTLVRRAYRRERLHEAHRSHGYQWLARRWQSHRRVTMAVLLIDLLWLLPCAAMAERHPPQAAWITVASLIPMFLLALAAGAGRREAGKA